MGVAMKAHRYAAATTWLIVLFTVLSVSPAGSAPEARHCGNVILSNGGGAGPIVARNTSCRVARHLARKWLKHGHCPFDGSVCRVTSTHIHWRCRSGLHHSMRTRCRAKRRHVVTFSSD